MLKVCDVNQLSFARLKIKMDCGYLGILSLDVAKMQPQQVENRYVEFRSGWPIMIEIKSLIKGRKE